VEERLQEDAEDEHAEMKPKAMPTQRQRNGFRPSARGAVRIARANVGPTSTRRWFDREVVVVEDVLRVLGRSRG
jgi:hypothetical protein